MNGNISAKLDVPHFSILVRTLLSMGIQDHTRKTNTLSSVVLGSIIATKMVRSRLTTL